LSKLEIHPVVSNPHTYTQGTFMMRPLFIIGLSVLFLFGCSSKKIAEKARINIAVMGFDARTGVKPGEAETIAESFAAQLQQTGRFTVVDRKQMRALLQEQGFQSMQSGDADASRAGKMLAVRKMINGSIGKLGDNYIFNIKVTDVETASIEISISKTYDDDLEDVMKKFVPSLVQEILDNMDGKKNK